MTVTQRKLLWATTDVLSVILGLILLSYVGYAFRMATWVFAILWILVPCMAWVINDHRVAVLFSTVNLKRIRICLMLTAIMISCFFVAHHDHLRDRLGQYIDDYSVQYHPEYDEFGRPYLAAQVSTRNWYARVGLWLGELILVVLCLSIPLLTWKGMTEVIETRNDGSYYP